MTWNQNMAAAPKSRSVPRTIKTTKGERTYNELQHEYVILNTKCAKALRSYWIPDEQRWAGLSKGEEPIAWQHWPTPLQAIGSQETEPTTPQDFGLGMSPEERDAAIEEHKAALRSAREGGEA